MFVTFSRQIHPGILYIIAISFNFDLRTTFLYFPFVITITFYPFNSKNHTLLVQKGGKKKAYDTGYSQAVTHPSTNPARPGLTSVIRREPVFSRWYGRRRKSEVDIFKVVFSSHTHVTSFSFSFQEVTLTSNWGTSNEHDSAFLPHLQGTGPHLSRDLTLHKSIPSVAKSATTCKRSHFGLTTHWKHVFCIASRPFG